jgi:hypothetical protein
LFEADKIAKLIGMMPENGMARFLSEDEALKKSSSSGRV